MTIYQPSQLHSFLNGLNTRAKKSLSQNFLIDGNILRKIVKTADVQPGDLVVEIGPGPGALTQVLLQAGAHVIAIEKDPVFAEALSRLQTEDGRLTVYCEDVLEFSFETLIPRSAKVVANLPYHITTPVLAKLLPLHALFSSITVMVQKEVGERMTAVRGTSAYSSLTLFLEYYAKATYSFTVEPTCFFPAPKVQSAVIKLELKETRKDIVAENFFVLTRTAFGKRRKMLRASLKPIFPQIESALQRAGIAGTLRPEELSLSDFIRLFLEVQEGERHAQHQCSHDQSQNEMLSDEGLSLKPIGSR